MAHYGVSLSTGQHGVIEKETGGTAADTAALFPSCAVHAVHKVRNKHRAPRKKYQMPPAEKSPCICWICGAKTTLETCKVDEHGLPVHEDCQTLRLSPQGGNLSKRENATVRPSEHVIKAS